MTERVYTVALVEDTKRSELRVAAHRFRVNEDGSLVFWKPGEPSSLVVNSGCWRYVFLETEVSEVEE